jgi:hypothetical protein
MRGLNEFISDIRACPPSFVFDFLTIHTFQVARENKRKNESTRSWLIFGPSSKVKIKTQVLLIHLFFIIDGSLNGYQKRKYVCKLIYIHLLGYDVDFGHMEAVNMISSFKYGEKQVVRFDQNQGSNDFISTFI